MRQFASGRSLVGSGDVQNRFLTAAMATPVVSTKDCLKSAYYNGMMNYNTYAQLATQPNGHNNQLNDIYGIVFDNNSAQQMAATTAGVGFLYADDGMCQQGLGADSRTLCNGQGFCGGVAFRSGERSALNVAVPIGNTLNNSFANNMEQGRFKETNIRQNKPMTPYN